VTNFTHYDDKLVFSLNNGTIELMSKDREYIPQPIEIIAVTNSLFR